MSDSRASPFHNIHNFLEHSFKSFLTFQTKDARQRPKLICIHDEGFKYLRHGSAGEESVWSCFRSCEAACSSFFPKRPVELLEMSSNDISTPSPRDGRRRSSPSEGVRYPVSLDAEGQREWESWGEYARAGGRGGCVASGVRA